ncbi:MAG: lipopolysaccharide biosynthesis protein [bacterium]
MKLRKIAAEGVKWTTIASVLDQILHIVFRIVLARLLFPEHYGLVASATVVIEAINVFTHLGISYFIVHQQERIETTCHTVFILLVGITVAGYLSAFLTAPWMADFFQDPAVELIIQVLALNLFLKVPGVVPHALVQKRFHFKQILFGKLAATITQGGIAIILALLLPRESGVWALVGGGLVSTAIQSLAYWYMSGYHLSLEFDFDLAKKCFHYGKYFLGMSILMYLYNSLDKIAIGRIMGIEALGYYSFAYTFSGRFLLLTEGMFAAVAFPIYAKLQDDTPRLRETYLRTLSYSALVSTPVGIGAALIGTEVILTLFGEKWIPAIIPFQILSLFVAVRAIDTTTGDLYAGIGHPKYCQNLAVVNVAGVALSIYPLAFYWGAAGAAISILLARLITMGVNGWICAIVLQCKMLDIVKALLPAITGVLIMGAVLLGVKYLFHLPASGVPVLLGLFLLGAVTYILGIYFTNYELFQEVISLIHTGIKGD